MSRLVMMRGSNMLRVGGLVPLTTTDFPGKLSAVIFCQGCPWQCRYCHNTHLIDPKAKGVCEWSEVISFLKRREGLLDAVVFSGGEPTMQAALCDAVYEIFNLGFLVGLHTAGPYPETLEEILPMMGWVGFDIKAPIGMYQKITQRPDKYKKVEKSISLILSAGVPYEFRTTYHRALLSEEDILSIARYLSACGVKKYVLQSFRISGCRDQELNSDAMPFGLSDEACIQIQELLPEVDIRRLTSSVI